MAFKSRPIQNEQQSRLHFETQAQSREDRSGCDQLHQCTPVASNAGPCHSMSTSIGLAFSHGTTLRSDQLRPAKIELVGIDPAMQRLYIFLDPGFMSISSATLQDLSPRCRIIRLMNMNLKETERH